MGWKGAIRSINAAANRAERERGKRERARQRATDKVDRDRDQVVAMARKLEEKLKRDPISPLKLRFEPSTGFVSEPFAFHTEIFTGELQMTAVGDAAGEFSPAEFTCECASVAPLDILHTRWGVVVALEVSNSDPEYRLRPTWFKKSDPQSSPAYLLDAENSRYYYPVASTLVGEVVAGHPRIGLIAFERTQQPTARLELHVSDVKLGKTKADRFSFSFAHTGEDLRDAISKSLASPALVSEVEEAMNGKVEEIRAQIKKAGSGCCLLAMGLAAAAAVAACTQPA